MMERGTVDIQTAFRKISNAWKMYRMEDGKAVPNGVQITVKHEEWADIIKAVYMATKDGGE